MTSSGMSLGDRPLPIGKAPAAVLERLLALPRKTSPALVVPPGIGEDAAVLRLGSRLVAVTADPITFRTPRPGYFAVHVNANDVAVMGASPRFFTMTLMVPPGTTEGSITGIMRDAIAAADSLDTVLIGGHTEITDAVRLPVVSVAMFGELLRATPVRTADGRPGDAIIQVGALGIEGTAILAAMHRECLVADLGDALVDRAANFTHDPGLSVVWPAVFAATRLPVHAMHDPTEGGLATGLREVALASGTGLHVRAADFIVLFATREICRRLGHDPLGLISSGCLLLTVARHQAAKTVALMRETGFPAADIGSLTPPQEGFILEDAMGRRHDLPAFAVDELASREK